ncbi:gamma-butyrobetaine hydroxylase-like domain-containing protein [Undibacterium sp. Ji50W]|uniref:gamma-butyrobetaine hydroxylase-like domain-containing protein n=1 Tax=Undibacterium sp. Ji50W TaxID=3413041 RepID=UPI003BF237DF
MSIGKPQPTALNARTLSRVLEVSFDDGKEFSLTFELLRVYSPSAEVRGHGQGQETLQTGKRDVGVVGIEPVGNYAIKPIFSDQHSSGIFSWDYLYWLGENQAQLWQDYLERLQAAGHAGETGRDAPMQAKGAGNCGTKH